MKKFGYRFSATILFLSVICLICTGFSSWTLSGSAEKTVSNVSVRFADILHQSQSNAFSNVKIDSDPLRFDAKREDQFGNVIFEDKTGSDGEQLDISVSGTLISYSSVLSVQAEISMQEESDQNTYDLLLKKGYLESPVFQELDRDALTMASTENYGSYWTEEKDATGEIRSFRMKSYFEWGSFFCHMNPADFFDSRKSNGEKQGSAYSLEEQKEILSEIRALNRMRFVVTLTATPISYEVNFISNSDQSSYDPIKGMTVHDTFTIPQETPVKEGATFLGWSLDPNGSAGEYAAGTEIKVSDVIEGEQTKISFYGIWDVVDITIFFDPGSGVGTKQSKVYKYGDSVILPSADELGFSKENNDFNGWKIDSNSETSYSANGVVELKEETFSGILSSKSLTFTAQWKSNSVCFVKGTEVTLADGTTEKIENLEISDRILSFNHESGTYESSSIAAIINHGREYYDVMYIYFSDGTRLGFIEDHGIFDIDEMRYVAITYDTVRDYIGHRFVRYGGSSDEFGIVTMIGYDIITEYTESYTIVSSVNLNHILNGMLSMTTVITGVYDYFEYDRDLRWNEEAMKRDIETYGLYTYDDWKSYTSFKVFTDFNFRYFRVSIGKGLMTEETVIGYIEWLNSCYEDGTAKQ